MNRFHVNIDRPESGWLSFRIKGEGGEINFCASYTPNDSFDDLVRCVNALYQYGRKQIIEINGEPEVYKLMLSKEHDELIVELANSKEEVIDKIVSNFETGCREFARKFKLLMDEVGYDGFVSEWKHRPPKNEIRELWEKFA